MLKFNELYETYAPEVYRFALWLSGSSFWAEDITSETFVRAWVHYLTIARNYYLGQLRKEKRIVDLNEAYPDPAPAPDQVIESLDKIRQVQCFLHTLSETDRAAFILRVHHELPYAEIARVLKLSLSASKVKVHRVRKKLLIHMTNKEV